MQLEVFKNIDEISYEKWDAHHNGSFYFRHSFLKTLADSKTEDARFRYLLFSQKEQAVGLAVLSLFQLHLDLLAGRPRWLSFLKKWLPNLLETNAVFVGLPCSFGQPPYFVFNEKHAAEVEWHIQKQLLDWAEKEKIALQIWKEFPENHQSSHFSEWGFLRFPSLSDFHLDTVKWPDAKTYVEAMKSSYRRKLRPSWEMWQRGQGFELKRFSPADVPDFYEGYRAVMKRTDTKLEIYPSTFFEKLANSPLPFQILTVKEGNHKISALLFFEDEILNFILVSKNQNSYENNLYGRLIHFTVFLAIHRNMSKIRFGQTSEYTKMSMGSEAVPLHFYLKSASKPVHYILKYFGNHIFPSAKTINHRVFKTETQSKIAPPSLQKIL